MYHVTEIDWKTAQYFKGHLCDSLCSAFKTSSKQYSFHKNQMRRQCVPLTKRTQSFPETTIFSSGYSTEQVRVRPVVN